LDEVVCRLQFHKSKARQFPYGEKLNTRQANSKLKDPQATYCPPPKPCFGSKEAAEEAAKVLEIRLRDLFTTSANWPEADHAHQDGFGTPKASTEGVWDGEYDDQKK
jgi:hypothetical protein